LFKKVCLEYQRGEFQLYADFAKKVSPWQYGEFQLTLFVYFFEKRVG